MNRNELKLDHRADVLALARRYAARSARRHFVACDAQVPGGGFLRDGKLLFDFDGFPLRIEELAGNPGQAELREGYTEALYGRSKGGLNAQPLALQAPAVACGFRKYGRRRKPGKAGKAGKAGTHSPSGVNWLRRID